MNLFVLGLSYKTAPVEVRERLAVPPSQLRCRGCRLRICGDLGEVVLLSTCNRVEIYGMASRLNGRLESLFDHLAPNVPDYRPHLYLHEEAAAAHHLLSVTSGLDSMVLGETEITGQVKHAYEIAREARLTGSALNRAFQTAFHTAKEIRTCTGVGRGATSVGSVTVQMAEKIFGPRLTRQTVMIIGAGKMGEACVRHLAKKGASTILVSNRSFDRARELAAEFGGQAIGFDDCVKAMARADIVVSSTGCPQTILHRRDLEALMQTRRNRPLVLIDIAVPRDIDSEAHSIPNVYLYNIDHLEQVVRENSRLRELELDRCRAILEKNTAALMAKITRTQEKPHDIHIQSEPGWLFCGPALCSR